MWATLTQVPYKLLLPLVLFITLVGTYSVNNSLWDVCLTMLFGVIGYFMKKMDIPVAALILTFVLGAQIESSLLQSLLISENGMRTFIERPISATLLGLAAIVFIISIYSEVKKKRSSLANDIEM